MISLKERDMNYRVRVHGGRKVESKRCAAYWFENLERPEHLVIKFVVWSHSSRLLGRKTRRLSLVERVFGHPEPGSSFGYGQVDHNTNINRVLVDDSVVELIGVHEERIECRCLTQSDRLGDLREQQVGLLR